MTHLPRYFLPIFASGLALGLASCSRNRAATRLSSQGQGVSFLRGNLPKGAQITLVPLDGHDSKAPRPGAQTKRNGSFRLSTFVSYNSAPAGRYAVTVIYQSPVRKVDDENMGPDLLRGRYADAKTTPLQAEIRTGNNELEPFNLQ